MNSSVFILGIQILLKGAEEHSTYASAAVNAVSPKIAVMQMPVGWPATGKSCDVHHMY